MKLRKRIRNERGFTIIELMVSLTVLLIGVVGILGMQLVTMRATSYSRHATEAAILGEDKMEGLRTQDITLLVGGSEVVDSQGVLDPTGLYTRTWTINWDVNVADLVIEVSWLEGGSEPHSFVYRTKRYSD